MVSITSVIYNKYKLGVMEENICQLCEEYYRQNKLSYDQNLLNIYRFEITYLFNLQPILVLMY